MHKFLSILKRLRPDSEDSPQDDQVPMPPTIAIETSPEPSDPLLLCEDEVADLLGIISGVVRRLNAGGRLPAPIRLGSFVRWRRAEIEAWVAAGCPSRKNWAWDSQQPQHVLRSPYADQPGARLRAA